MEPQEILTFVERGKQSEKMTLRKEYWKRSSWELGRSKAQFEAYSKLRHLWHICE